MDEIERRLNDLEIEVVKIRTELDRLSVLNGDVVIYDMDSGPWMDSTEVS